jgi:hypothetical protein
MECRSVFPRMSRIREVAEILNLSYEASRRLIKQMKNVFLFGHGETRSKRRYISPRISEPQLKAVIVRLSA